jgi:hypothetical protein
MASVEATANEWKMALGERIAAVRALPEKADVARLL